MHDHDHKHRRPSIGMFLTNLHVDMPLSKKVWLLFRNNMKKILTLSSCCGHHGEPGC
ncbi:MAG: hypothetical protein NT178_05035 [Proteobacteria bacterium]|nr:hypothetical protein [Pseudomonadota bacterium]